MNFTEFKLEASILRGLKKMEIISPTKIQEKAIPAILKSQNTHVLAQARTGSGKTLAFSVPIAQLLDNNQKTVQCVIIVPTRELCKQVAEVFADLTKFNKLKVVQVYGGVSDKPQIKKIKHGAQIVVATPGRLIDLFKREKVSFKDVKYVVLDEADRCLDMGFFPDIEYLLFIAMSGVKPQMLLFSATMLDQVKNLAKKFTEGKNTVEIDVSQDSLTVENCDQYYYLINRFKDKYYHFIRIVKKVRPKHAMVFVNTKKTANWLYHRLKSQKNFTMKAEIISGDLSQNRRESVLGRFKSHRINCLIATDVASRGLDIEKVSHVFNYDLPKFEESYVHRIGRTARVSGKSGKVEKGTAISLVLRDEFRDLSRIEGFMDKKIYKRPLPLRKGHRNKRKYHRSRKSANIRKKKHQEKRRNFLY